MLIQRKRMMLLLAMLLPLALPVAAGQELQINVLDPARLRAALADPQRHRDLVVRVAGLNARFVELSPKEQQELLLRAELACR